MTFTVEIKDPEDVQEGNHTVEIFVSADGIEKLLIDLEHLKTAKPGTSLRLFSSAWGGGELSSTPQRTDSVMTNLLRIWRAE
ncbi:MAG: hypothetical protein BM558_07665 [Roseobacter sp. MedPE-SW]|nr:MAG: hypothetical protein BM558_07665 [Roseobacter sp. MedPE-SW]